MSKEEYMVMLHFGTSYNGNAVYSQAVKRFWSHHEGNTIQVDGLTASSSGGR